MSKILIVGCGYLGLRAARQLLARGSSVHALTRSAEKAKSLAEMDIVPIVGDWYQPNAFESLDVYDSIIISVSHAAVPEIEPTQTHIRGLANLFNALQSQPKRIVYLSTTGVYATRFDGAWVDETSAVAPNRPGTIAAWSAEQWLASRFDLQQLTILRASGIYGPDRIPRLDKLLAGHALEIDPETYLNLIHVDDLASIVAQLTTRCGSVNLYNVSDGNPVLRRNYYEFIAARFHAPAPQFIECSARDSKKVVKSNDVKSTRGEGNKRISNRKLVEDFDPQFFFPNYQAGLLPLL